MRASIIIIIKNHFGCDNAKGGKRTTTRQQAHEKMRKGRPHRGEEGGEEQSFHESTIKASWDG
jgi:hypothetical protein